MAIIRVPKSLLVSAKRDLPNFIRDIANFTQRGARPFIRRMTAIKNMRSGLENPFNPFKLNFEEDFKCLDNFPRFLHFDLSVTKDSVGVSCCHVPHYVDSETYDETNSNYYKTKSPYVKFDFWGKISVKRGQEIILSEIREIIYELSRRGFYIALITFDRFQSIDSIQILRSFGYLATHLSVDRTSNAIIIDRDGEYGFRKMSTEGNTNAAMQNFKDLLYNDRLSIPDKSKYFETYYPEIEAKTAQETRSGKIDHPPKGSIDVLHSLAGSAYNAVMNSQFYDASETETNEKNAEDSFYKEFDNMMTSREADYHNDETPYSIF